MHTTNDKYNLDDKGGYSTSLLGRTINREISAFTLIIKTIMMIMIIVVGVIIMITLAVHAYTPT